MSQSVNIPLTDSESSLLNATTEQLGVSPHELARTTVVDALNRLRSDEQFTDAVRSVLAKNAQLYDRLAK